jgi:hypothetical protein
LLNDKSGVLSYILCKKPGFLGLVENAARCELLQTFNFLHRLTYYWEHLNERKNSFISLPMPHARLWGQGVGNLRSFADLVRNGITNLTILVSVDNTVTANYEKLSINRFING